MTATNEGVKEGDWVRIKHLWPGVWRIARVLSGFREDRWSLDDPVKMSTSTLVFCHRAFNNSWKRSFSFQSCELLLVERLSDDEREQVNALFARDARLREAFAKYERSHNSIDAVANVSLGALGDAIIKQFQSLCEEMLSSRIAHGATLDEVLQLLRDRDLEKHIRMIPKHRTLQLVCINRELRGDEFLYRRFRTLNF
jgi:hypothetical protein